MTKSPKIVILHLSDIHIKTHSDPIISRAKNIADTLNLCAEEGCNCFLIISGDISFSGNSLQYNIASEFITNIVKEINQNKKVSEVHIILTPGNHDCNFDNVKTTRLNLINHLLLQNDPYNNIDDDLICELTLVQGEYFSFAQKFNSIIQPPKPLFGSRKYQIDTYEVNILCLNTPWMSTQKEDPGKLIFPTNLINDFEIPPNNNSITISVFHHPYNWFNPTHLKEFKNYVDSKSNVIITGHEHDIDNQTIFSIKGKIKEIMQGGLLQHHEQSDSSFNIQVIDLQKREQRKILFLWNAQEHFYKPEEETDWMPFLSMESSSNFEIQKDFRRILSRLDVQITHPKLPKLLEIEDIYVSRSVEVQYSKGGILSKDQLKINTIDGLLDIVKAYKKILILGNKYYGKSILLKKLFIHLFADNYVPLYCKGRELIKLGKQTETMIHQLFNSQYQNNKDMPYQKYRQINIDKKVILIDDLNKSTLDIDKIELILNKLQSHFGIFILASNPVISIDVIFDDPSALIDFTRVTIDAFGLPGISDIIDKWIRLSNPDSNENDIQNKIRSLENSIFNEINKDIIPRNPFFILTILHKREMEKSPESQIGSYGYYFQTIINVMVAKLCENPILMGYIFDYFSNLAFHMLSKNTGSISEDDLEKLNEEYLYRTGFNINLNQIIENSIREEVLLHEQNTYSFSRTYYLEFFAAKYISDNLQNPKNREEMLKIIEEISLHVHKEIYCDIMMFLCFHSRDPVILDVVNKKAQTIFGDLINLDLHKDVEFLNKLTQGSIIHYLVEKPRAETKKEILEFTDIAIDELGEIRDGLIREVKELEELSISQKVVYGYSLVRILGQIIKRYLPGDLDDRIRLTKQCYDLGLHTIKYVFNKASEDIPKTQEELSECILRRNPSISIEKLGSATNDWIWSLCESVCLSCIKNISYNVGAPQLKTVYKQILEKYPDIAYGFINISIALDHYDDVPEKKIIDLAKKLDESKNYFCKDFLKILFIYHIYQFYVPFDKIQRIAAALGLERILKEPNIFLKSHKLAPRKN